MYHNTNKESGNTLIKSNIKADSQEWRVLRVFSIIPKPMGPNMVMKWYNNYWPSVPPTSIRRAITNLTTKGKLVKTNAMEIGGYGKKEHKWQLASYNPTGYTFECRVCKRKFSCTDSKNTEWCSLTCAKGG